MAYIVCVRVHVVEGKADEFVDATLENAAATRQEPGNLRFDVLRRTDDGNRLFLYEVYRDEEGFHAHQQTRHYLVWRERVAPMMAEPRQGDRHANIVPEPWA